MDGPNELATEEETYLGGKGAEMKITLPYCGHGSDCTAVAAANTMDRIAESFFEAVGRGG